MKFYRNSISIIKKVILIGLLSWNTWGFAVTDLELLSSPQKQQQFEQLVQRLRCLVCQNQTLADSQAPLAQDLRRDIANKINLGKTEAEITEFLVQRYGSFILYDPPLSASTFLLWFGPFILLLIGLTYYPLSRLLGRKRNKDGNLCESS